MAMPDFAFESRLTEDFDSSAFLASTLTGMATTAIVDRKPGGQTQSSWGIEVGLFYTACHFGRACDMLPSVPFFKMANNRDLRVFIPAPSGPSGTGCKTRLTSRIKKFQPHFIWGSSACGCACTYWVPRTAQRLARAHCLRQCAVWV